MKRVCYECGKPSARGVELLVNGQEIVYCETCWNKHRQAFVQWLVEQGNEKSQAVLSLLPETVFRAIGKRND
jgi:hypothetical protein